MENLKKSMLEIGIHDEGIQSYIPDIPEKATIRWEHTRCDNIDCRKCQADPDDPNQNENEEKCQLGHGPYMYAYWREGKKVRKKYIGKSFEDYKFRQIAKRIELTPTRLMKSKICKHVSYIRAAKPKPLSKIGYKVQNRLLVTKAIACDKFREWKKCLDYK